MKVSTCFMTSLLTFLGACSHNPSYEKLRTADEALNKYDQNRMKDGLAITKKGAVVDVQFEEVQAQKNRLELEVEEKKNKIHALERELEDRDTYIMELRSHLGLSPHRPKTHGKCCTPDGKIIPESIKEAPSLEEELKMTRNGKRKTSSQDDSETGNASE